MAKKNGGAAVADPKTRKEDAEAPETENGEAEATESKEAPKYPKAPKETREVDPSEIVASSKLNLARWKPHSPDTVESLARDFRARGQIVPLVVREKNGDLELVAGFRRLAAAKKYNEMYPNSQMKVRVDVFELTDEQALSWNIATNEQNDKPTPMDRAISFKHLEAAGFKKSDMAKMCRIAAPTVSVYMDLLDLDVNIQELIHVGQLPYQAGRSLKGLKPEEQAEAVERAKVIVAEMNKGKENGEAADPTALGKEVTKQSRETKQNKGDTTGVVGLTLKEFKEWLKSYIDAEDTPKDMTKLCEKFLKFLSGTLKQKTMENALEEALVCYQMAEEGDE